MIPIPLFHRTSSTYFNMSHIIEHQTDLHDEKANEIDHKELAEVDYGLRKSRFDDLSIPRTLWVFRKTVLVVLSVYTGTL
jgi:hypothetical protein